jgi:alpha-glucosidase (family GH31 glycosyl hydrolase)
MMENEWNSEAYNKQYKIASKLTDKGCRIALNQGHALTYEACEAYKDVLRERGYLLDEESSTIKGYFKY